LPFNNKSHHSIPSTFPFRPPRFPPWHSRQLAATLRSGKGHLRSVTRQPPTHFNFQRSVVQTLHLDPRRSSPRLVLPRSRPRTGYPKCSVASDWHVHCSRWLGRQGTVSILCISCPMTAIRNFEIHILDSLSWSPVATLELSARTSPGVVSTKWIVTPRFNYSSYCADRLAGTFNVARSHRRTRLPFL